MNQPARSVANDSVSLLYRLTNVRIDFSKTLRNTLVISLLIKTYLAAKEYRTLIKLVLPPILITLYRKKH